MADRMTWSDDDLIDGRTRTGTGAGRPGASPRRLSLVAMLAGGVIAAALVGSGVTWLLVDHGSSGAGSAGAPPPLIKADEKPIKVSPESPGGMTVENADKLVYSRLRGESRKGDVERILPAPEQPQRPPLDETPVASAPPSSSAVPAMPHAGDGGQGYEHSSTSGPTYLGPNAAVAPDEDAEEEPVTAPAPAPAPAPVHAAPAPAPAPAAKPAPKAAASKPVQVAAATPLPTPPVNKPVAKVEPTKKSAPAASGNFQVQILAARSAEDASAAWKKIQAKNGDVLGGMSSSVARADLGDRGVFYRLRVGPIASEAKAQSLCSALASRNVSCLIIRPGR